MIKPLALARPMSVLLLVAVLPACSGSPQETGAGALAAGDRYVAEGRTADAMIEYRRAIQADPQSAEAHFKLAKVYMTQGDGDNAFREAARAADLAPTNIDARLLVARLMVLGGNYDGARKLALEVLAAEPRHVDAQIVLGNALAQLKDVEGAIKAIGSAINEDPSSSLAYTNLGMLQATQGNRAEAELAFRRAIAADPASDRGYLALANLYWAAAEFDKAEAELKAAVKAVPASGIANLSLATFYLNRQQPSQAETYLKAHAGVSDALSPKLTLSDFYAAQGRPNDSRAVLQPLTQRADAFADANLRLAALDYGEGKKDSAAKLIEDVLARDKRHEHARVMKIQHLLIDEKVQEALDLSRALVADYPTSARSQYIRGSVLLRSGALDEAGEAFRQVLNAAPSAVPAQLQLARIHLELGDGAAAAQFAQQAVKNQPNSGEAHLYLAKALLKQAQFDSAMRELDGLAKAFPNWSDVHATRGIVFLARRNFPEARKAYELALKHSPTSIDALSGLATLDVGEKRGDRARARVEARAKEAPNDPDVAMLLGQTYVALNEPRLAEQAFKKVVQINPAKLDAYGALARIYVTEKRLDEARTEFEAITKQRPKDYGTVTMVGMIHELKGDKAEARKRYEQALAINSDAGVAANNLANLYVEAGENLDRALTLAKTAKAQLPNQHEIDDTLGWVYYKKNLSTLAITSLKTAVTAQPENPLYLYHLGAAYAQNKETFNARQSLEKALKIRADFPGADDARKILGTLRN